MNIDDPHGGLEPIAATSYGDGAHQLLASIAISMKRIADYFEELRREREAGNKRT